MTLDEAIKHCEEKAEALKAEADYIPECDVPDCLECASEHEQLAEWLKDYKRLLEEQRTQGEYERAFEIACDLLNDGNLYGIDADNLFALIMQKYGIVSTLGYQKFILEHLDRFSDDDEIRLKAIERLGW